MSSHDTERFELCKEVYKRTELETKGNYYVTVKGKSTIWHWEDAQWLDKTERFPLYTSDYLLEKLPNVVLSHSKGFSYRVSTRLIRDRFTADTPLNALLKLVIALDDAKELPHA